MATTPEQINQAIITALQNQLGTIVTETTKAVKRSLQEDVQTTVEKKVKQDEIPKFRRKYNEDQFKHSKAVEKIFDNIKTNLEANDINKATSSVNEGMKLISKRQKHILLADREEDGWEVVKCYEADDLADGTDDEKRIEKSRRQAKTNKKESKARRQLGRGRNYDFNNRDYLSRDLVRSRDSYSSRDRDLNKDSKYSFSRACYFCGREGHYQYNCPIRREQGKGH